MRILHVLDHSVPLHSGYSFRTLSIIREQRKLGWETLHVTGPKQGEVTGLVESAEGMEFFRTEPLSSFVNMAPALNQVGVIRRLAHRVGELAEEHKPDVIHAHSPSLDGVAAVRAGENLGIPVVYEVRAFWEDAAVDHGTAVEAGFRYRLSRGLESWVLRRASAVTTICEGLRNDIVNRGIPEDKVTVIPNAVDLDKFEWKGLKDGELVSDLGLEGRFVLGFVGSFYAYEGLTLLIQALPCIVEKHPEVAVLLVGGGPDEVALRRLVQQLDLARHVMFIGRVPHREVNRYYSLVDLLVYPRLSMRLTELVTPLKPLEAMAQGIPFVASDVGGHRELIRNGENGVLFAHGSGEALVYVINDLIADPTKLPELVVNGRNFVEKERNWTVSVGRYEDVYTSAQKRPSRS